MELRELTRQACLRVLSGSRLARLACARGDQPYIVPVYLAYHEATGCLYGFTTPGHKVEWMRDNPLVCVESDHVTASDRWVSVVVFGRYEELPVARGQTVPPAGAPERPRQSEEARPTASADGRNRRYVEEDADGDDGEGREEAWRVLRTLPAWWEPGGAAWAARSGRDPAAPFDPVYYRIRIDRVTGHEATRDALPDAAPAPQATRRGWLNRAIARVSGGLTAGSPR